MTSAVPDKLANPKKGKRTSSAVGHPVMMEAPLCVLDHIIEKLIVGLLIFMPLALGARSAWAEEVVIAASGLILVVFLLKQVVYRQQRFIWTWAYVPVLVLVLVSAGQLVPWPTAWVKAVSPNTVTLKTELLEDIPLQDANTPASETMTLSLYPHATQHDLRMVLAVASVFVVVINVFRRTDQIKRLLLSIALIGGAVALIALLQDFFGNGKIFWVIPSPHETAYAGPFFNHSHYGQFMNLSIGATLAYLFVKLSEAFLRRKASVSILARYITLPSSRPLWGLIGIISLGAVTVFISLTRGGMVSVIAATTFITVLLVRRGSLHGLGWVMVVISLMTFTGILYLGFDMVLDRFSSLSEVGNYGIRGQIIQDLTQCFRQFPFLGTGLGTHAVVYPMFQSVDKTVLFTHAENEYAQLMEETGLVGLLSMVWFGLIVWINFAKSAKDQRLPIRAAIYGLGFGLIAILVHSLSDFGQHVPANVFLSVIFCALLLVLPRMGRSTEAGTSSRQFAPMVMRGMALAIGCGMCIWSVIGAHKYQVAEAYWSRALTLEKELAANQWQGTDDQYDQIISLSSLSSAYQPDNIEYRYWLNLYRWYQVSRNEDLVRGFLPDASMAIVQDVVKELYQVCHLCPTFGPSYSILGQIKKQVFYEDEEGASLIRKAARLAPCDPIICQLSGMQDIEEGLIDASLEKFKKAIRLSEGLFPRLADIYIDVENRPDLAIILAEENIGRLSLVANLLDKKGGFQTVEDEIRARVRALLEEQCAQPNAPASAFISLANIYQKNKDYDAAIELYYRALVLDYGRVNWRLQLARLLADNGQIAKAINEAKICLNLRPHLKAAETLIEDLSGQPDIVKPTSPAPR